jgi:hypothetical protein
MIVLVDRMVRFAPLPGEGNQEDQGDQEDHEREPGDHHDDYTNMGKQSYMNKLNSL